MPLTWASVPVGKPVIVSFVVRMGRVNYASCFSALLYVHSNAARAGFGSLSGLFDLGTFDGVPAVAVSPACRRMPAPLPLCVPLRPFLLLRPRPRHPPHIRLPHQGPFGLTPSFDI